MKEPTRPSVTSKARKSATQNRTQGKTASQDEFDLAALKGVQAALARSIARIEKTARSGNVDEKDQRNVSRTKEVSEDQPLLDALVEITKLENRLRIFDAANSGDFTALADHPRELELAQTLYREQSRIHEQLRNLKKPKYKPELYVDERPKFDRTATRRGSEKRKIESRESSGYSRLSPRGERRAAGDTHVAKDLRHEKHVTGARAETTQRQPKQLSSHERTKFLAYAKAHQWDSDGDVRPSDHIKKNFARWLKLGLARIDIIAAQENLAQAYSTEISRNPDRRIEELVVRPHSLPPGAKRALSTSLVSELTPQELERKRAMERDKKQRQRLKKKPKNLAQ